MRYMLTLLLWPALCQAQTVKLPPEVKAEPGMVLVKSETDCPTVEWWAPDGGLQVIPSDLLKDTKTAVCFAMKPGRYRLQAVVAKGDKPAYAMTTVIVVNPGPTPPGPGPEPVPPTDPFAKAILDAYSGSPEPDKAESLAWLASSYRAAAQQVKSAPQMKVADFHASLAGIISSKI